MIKNYKFLLFAFLLISVPSCTDLSEELVGEITTDVNIPGSEASGAENFVDNFAPPSDAMDGAFGQLRGAGTANHGGYYSIQEITSDEQCIGTKGGDWFDGGILLELHRHTYTPVHGFINNAWTGHYAAINSCNELLAGTKLDENGKAQIRVLRAYFYMRLVDLFGNVPIVKSPGEKAPQATRNVVFDFVEKEILDALGVTSITSGQTFATSALGNTANVYRISKWAALGILSHLYLNAEVWRGTKMYDKAELAAGYVIDNSGAKLCGVGCKVKNFGRRPKVASDPNELEGYAAVFAPNNGGNPEHIFAAYYNSSNAGGMNFVQMNYHYGTQFSYNLDQQPWNGYATLEEFYNSYADNDLRKKANFLVGPQFRFDGTSVLDYATDDGNPVLDYTPKINQLWPNHHRQGGARAAKFSLQQFGRQEMNNDFPIIRLGDIYLVRAEAKARNANNWALALSDVNVIRNRAGLANASSMDAAEFLKERGREMFVENSRRTDLIRFGKFNDAWWEKPASQPFRNLFPIPQNQIDNSGGTLKQNPGY